MVEYIEREAVLEIINRLNIASSLYAGRRIINLPSADVAPVRHAKWEHDHYENCCDNFEIVKCSCCGHQAYAIAFYVKSGNYCPNCGAKMDLEDNHDND